MGKSYLVFFLITVTALFAQACGGGGGGSENTDTDNIADTDTGNIIEGSSPTKLIGTSSADYGEGVAVDSSGNVYITGATYGDLDGNTNAGSTDIFIAKYDSSGTKLWTKLFGTSGEDYGSGIAVDSSGNAYITGGTKGDLDGNTNAGHTDIFIAKYDFSGTKLWTKLLGTSSSEKGHSVAVDFSGNAYVTGRTRGDLDGNTNAGGDPMPFDDIFIAKYDSSGTKLWTKLLGTSSNEYGIDVAVDSSGNAYVTGYTDGDLDGNTNANNGDIFLTKYNSSGTKQWTKLLSTSESDAGYSVAVDSSGNAYITGSMAGDLISEGHLNTGGSDILIAKYDSSGTRLWTAFLGTSAADIGFGVAVDSSDNAYITGVTYGDLDAHISTGRSDIFIAKYDSGGTKLWTKLLGTLDYEGGDDIAVDSNGNSYVIGDTLGDLDGNANAGSTDIFITKFDSDGNLAVW